MSKNARTPAARPKQHRYPDRGDRAVVCARMGGPVPGRDRQRQEAKPRRRDWEDRMKRPSWCLATRIMRAVAATTLCVGASSIPAMTISTSADPSDGWRVIAPLGNLEGQPIASVGLDWEAAHPEWNTS